jgi:hypothetical protein
MYYEVEDQRLACGRHGRRVRACIHLYVENGDPNNPEHSWRRSRNISAMSGNCSKRGRYEDSVTTGREATWINECKEKQR